MTDSQDNHSDERPVYEEHWRQAADELHQELFDSQLPNEQLTKRVNALRQDTIALLRGIRNGTIRTGQSRIFANVMEILDLMEHHDCKNPRLENVCIMILDSGTTNGLTVEGLEFEPNRGKWQERE